MFVERRLNSATNKVELWWCEWALDGVGPAKKVQLTRISDEPHKMTAQDESTLEPAICWAYGRTVGNVAVFSPTLLGHFPGQSGDDAVLLCDFVQAGKFRHGPERWWCRTHQTYWGTKADIEAYEQNGAMCCSAHAQPMSYVLKPFTLNLGDFAEVGIWCSMPAAISTEEINKRPPRIHVHVRPEANGRKTVDRDFQAISVLYGDQNQLFGNDEITRVNITPPAAFDFVTGIENGREMSWVNCGRCGYPHLDLGRFALVPHKKHYCGNCGYDSTHSSGKIISTPLKPLHDQYSKTLKYEVPDRTIDLDQYSDCTYTVWASTPAVVWTAARPQELGIHVHIHRKGLRIVDDTFGEVIHQGAVLQRADLVKMMAERSIV